MSSLPSTTPQPSTTPSSEVEPINDLLSDAFLKDPKFLLTALVGGLAIFIYLLYGSSSRGSSSALKRGKGGEPVVVLTGPSDSGKTTIFSKLIYDHPTETHTSLKPSTSTLVLSPSTTSSSSSSGKESQPLGKRIKISDIPGHPRLKPSTKDLLREASAGVFVLDVSGLIRNGSGVAEQLPPILTQLAASSLTNPSHPIPRLLILAHKTDLLSRSSVTSTTTSPSPETQLKLKSTAIERTKLILTREMDRLKSSRGTSSGRIEGIERVTSGGGSTLSGMLSRFFPFLFSSPTSSGPGEKEDEESVMEEAELMIWGREGKFDWDHVEGVEVVWGSSCVKPAEGVIGEQEGSDGLEDLREWLADL